jgi:hypothetical protein
MTLPELQACLERLGVKLSLRLVVDAPAGVVTADIRDALAAHKPRLLTFLSGKPSVRSRGRRHRPAPNQMAMLFTAFIGDPYPEAVLPPIVARERRPVAPPSDRPP